MIWGVLARGNWGLAEIEWSPERLHMSGQWAEADIHSRATVATASDQSKPSCIERVQFRY
jgi:hypothetical protein